MSKLQPRHSFRRFLPLLLGAMFAGRLAGSLRLLAADAPEPAVPPVAARPAAPVATSPAPAKAPPVVATPRARPGSHRVDDVVLAVDKVLGSVVNISTERVVSSRNQRYDSTNDLFEQFFGGEEQRTMTTSSLGSGVIVDAGGLIITNDHVVQRASRIIVTLADGRNFDAIPVAADETNDLALLRIQGYGPDTPLTAIDFGAPDDLYLGESVLTVGNPFGLGHSVSSGILSAKARRAIYQGQVLYSDILQTDAAINPGNSGGPLVNLDAELIGINLAIRADAQGIGFAIPLKRIEDVLAGWMLPSRFGMNEIGLVPGTMLDSQGVPYAVVRRALPDTPAARAGLKDGDRIDAVDGVPVRQSIEISRILWRLTVGDAVVLTLHDGRDVRVVVGALKPLSGEEVAQQYFHLEVQELTPRLAAALRLPYTRGLVISGVEPGSLLDRQGIVRGDVIIQVGEAPISCFADLGRALLAAHPGDVVPVIFDRIQSVRGRMVLHRFSLAVTI